MLPNGILIAFKYATGAEVLTHFDSNTNFRVQTIVDSLKGSAFGLYDEVWGNWGLGHKNLEEQQEQIIVVHFEELDHGTVSSLFPTVPLEHQNSRDIKARYEVELHVAKSGIIPLYITQIYSKKIVCIAMGRVMCSSSLITDFTLPELTPHAAKHHHPKNKKRKARKDEGASKGQQDKHEESNTEGSTIQDQNPLNFPPSP